MPTLNIEYRTSDGKQAAPDGLMMKGPLLLVTLSSVHEDGKKVEGLALIDTGATRTCVDIAKAEEAGMNVVGAGQINSAAGPRKVPLFAAKVEIKRVGVLTSPRCLGVDLQGQDIIALIGRDLLRRAVFVYNGTNGTVSLSLS